MTLMHCTMLAIRDRGVIHFPSLGHPLDLRWGRGPQVTPTRDEH
jgi:hypothetical protein